MDYGRMDEPAYYCQYTIDVSDDCNDDDDDDNDKRQQHVNIWSFVAWIAAYL